MNTIFVIGAGAAGLSAGNHLSEKGYHVTILEARNRTGGKIHTIHDPTFSGHVEAGAEFIHGKLPTTLNLLKKFNIDYHTSKGKWYRVKKGQVVKAESFIEQYRMLEQHLREMKEDISVEDFLNFHFPGIVFDDFKQSVRNFVEGYDAADTTRASTLNFKQEWLTDDDEQQYRIRKGYSELTDAMTNSFVSKGGVIHLETVVKKIEWKKGKVTIHSAEGATFEGEKLIITIPPPLLYDNRHVATLTFSPPLPQIAEAASKIGYGTVIKILVEVENRLWDKPEFLNAGWILSDEIIPTWWTQLPDDSNILTGWLAGPRANEMSKINNDEIMKMAFDSLASIFNLSPEVVRKNIKAAKIFNWKSDPFSVGAYSYATLNRLHWLHILNQPIENTIYFAGEALESENTGTVEAALVSGIKAAERISSIIKN